MRKTRIRELTRGRPSGECVHDRNEENPMKGIDTAQSLHKVRGRTRCRNGANPDKGIDT